MKQLSFRPAAILLTALLASTTSPQSPAPDVAPSPGPRPLAPEARVEDWPGFLGPRRDGHSMETGLRRDLPPSAWKPLWTTSRGTGYAGPAIAKGRLVHTHRVDNEAVIEALDALTGQVLWQHRYPCEYRGKFIRNSGPRATPLIASDTVFVHGVEGRFVALDVETGKLRWERDTHADFGSDEDFFGVVSSPLLYAGLLILQIGAAQGATVVGLDPVSGKETWRASNGWRASCASPVVGTLGGEDRLFVLAGGESRPPVGGLLVLNPGTGVIQHEFAFRARRELSVVGATPVFGDDFILLSDGYGAGTVALDIDEEGQATQRWESRMGLEFTNPLVLEGYIWAIDGVTGRAGALTCLDPKTGEELVRKDIDWTETVADDGKQKEFSLSIGQGSMLAVDDDLLCLGDDGALLWIDAKPDSIEVLARTRLFHAIETWTPPVVCHGLLYVCQNKRERFGDAAFEPRLLCYDLRGGASK